MFDFYFISLLILMIPTLFGHILNIIQLDMKYSGPLTRPSMILITPPLLPHTSFHRELKNRDTLKYSIYTRSIPRYLPSFYLLGLLQYRITIIITLLIKIPLPHESSTLTFYLFHLLFVL